MEAKKEPLGVSARVARPKTRVLSDVAVRNAKAGDRPYKIFDGAGLGLYLLVTPTGSKLWRHKYRYDGHEKLLSLGQYPALGLKEARERTFQAKKLLADGIDPAQAKQAEKIKRKNALTFQQVATEWLTKNTGELSPDYRDTIRTRLENDVFPWLGKKPINAITTSELLKSLRRVEARGAVETAHRITQYCSRIFRYAVACDVADRDISVDLRGAIAPAKVQHFAAIVDPSDVGALLRAIEGYKGSFVTACALRLSPLVFVRPGELRKAEWSEFDLDAAEWRIPGEKMKVKTREPHIVPLSRQAIAILRELRPRTGGGRYLFTSVRTSDRPMSNNTVNAALRRLGYTSDEMTAHGFRAMASTLLNERGYAPDVIERQLAHYERNKVRAAYNRAEYLKDRRAMMQAWADYLDQLAKGGQVIAFPTNRMAKA